MNALATIHHEFYIHGLVYNDIACNFLVITLFQYEEEQDIENLPSHAQESVNAAMYISQPDQEVELRELAPVPALISLVKTFPNVEIAGNEQELRIVHKGRAPLAEAIYVRTCSHSSLFFHFPDHDSFSMPEGPLCPSGALCTCASSPGTVNQVDPS